jgi:hypothetical protein
MIAAGDVNSGQWELPSTGAESGLGGQPDDNRDPDSITL